MATCDSEAFICPILWIIKKFACLMFFLLYNIAYFSLLHPPPSLPSQFLHQQNVLLLLYFLSTLIILEAKMAEMLCK